MSQNPFADPYQPPQPFPSGAASFVPGQKPAVWTWYVVYCTAMALLYLLCTGLGVALLVGGAALADNQEEAMGLFIQGVVFSVICVPLLILYAAAPFLPRTKFAWFYGFATIGLGLTSCCTLPFSIALLIQWLKPEVKAYLNAL
jgi:hypothetical protein